MQAPSLQVWPGLHTLPQPPQLVGSESTVAHEPLHKSWADPQVGVVVDAERHTLEQSRCAQVSSADVATPKLFVSLFLHVDPSQPPAFSTSRPDW